MYIVHTSSFLNPPILSFFPPISPHRNDPLSEFNRGAFKERMHYFPHGAEMCEIDVMNISLGTFKFNPKPTFPDYHCPMAIHIEKK